MKYIALILGVLFLASSVLGIWYYRDTQNTITTLTENNAQLETAISLNEKTVQSIQEDLENLNIELNQVNQEFAEIRAQNQVLEERFEDHDLGELAASRPELIERIINTATDNAGRCFEILSGAELTEQEINAENGNEFNSECPWIYDDLVAFGRLRR